MVGALVLSFAWCGCAGYGSFVEGTSYIAAHPEKARDANLVRVGDRLSIRVFGEEPLSVSGMRVRPNGAMTLPLLGDYQVAGKTPTAISRELEKALAAYVNAPHVTVFIEQSPVKITVIGELGHSGPIEAEWPLSLISALAQAGGLGDFADETGIFVLRGSDRIRFNYEDVLRGDPKIRNFLLETGDVIVVE